MAKKLEYCEECANELKVSAKREECLDICDKCYDKLAERVKFLSDRDNRMLLVRAATMHASNSNNEETRLRCFMASVMPEVPQRKVDKMIRAGAFKWQTHDHNGHLIRR